jgi:hypothetical protein
MRILIVRLSSMGDIVHTLPLAANARRAGVEVGWLVERSHAGVLEGNPSIDRLFVAETQSWRRNPLRSTTRRDLDRLSGELAEFHPDYAIEAHGLWKSILVARLAHAPTTGAEHDALRAIFGSVRRPSRCVWNRERSTSSTRTCCCCSLSDLIVAGSRTARHLLAREDAAAEDFWRRLPRPFRSLPSRHSTAGEGLGRIGARLASGWRRAESLSRGLVGPGRRERVARFAERLPRARVVPLLDLAGLARDDAASLFVAGDTGTRSSGRRARAAGLALWPRLRPARSNVPEPAALPRMGDALR